MSIAVAGKLTVIERNGTRGIFMVGELSTTLGNFKIKHRVLDQFPQGSYDGVFHITRIYNQSNFYKGQVWVSLSADLEWNALQIMAENQVAEVPESLAISGMVEHNDEFIPVAETEKKAPLSSPTDDTVVQHPTQQVATPIAAPTQIQPEDELIDSLDRLESLIQATASGIRLDVSIDDRSLFRQLRDRLKEAGYRFDSGSQSWHTGA